MIRLLPALLLFFLSADLSHAEAKFYGSAAYSFGTENKTVKFGCGGISNNSKTDAIGTLQVRLWALDNPYQGGTISGKILGEYKLEGLNPGAYYSPVSKTVNTKLPGTKKWYWLCLTVSEYKGGGYVLSDYRNFPKAVTLGPLDLFKLEGPWSCLTSNEGGTIEIAVAKISHNRPANTGTLELSVWVTKDIYRGGGIRGFQLGSVKKDALKMGYSYSNVKHTAKFTKPPAGTYNTYLLLSEYDGSGYKIVDYIPAARQMTF